MLPLLIWISDPFSRRQIADEKQCSFCGKQFTLASDSSAGNKSNNVCHCEFGCGASYCNPECCSNDKIIRCHERLCVGRYSEDHPLFQFKVFAMESGSPEVYSTLMLSLTLVVIQSATKKSTFGDEWLTTSTPHYDDGYDGIIVDSSYDLLLEILSSDNVASPNGDNHSIRTKQDWECLLSSVNQKTITVDKPSIWSNICRDVTKANGWTEDNPLLDKARSFWEIDGGDDGDGDGDDNEKYDEDGIEDEVSTTVIDIVHLMDEPDYYFPPMKCSILFEPDFYSSVKHSCVPNHSISVQEYDQKNDDNDHCLSMNLQKLPQSEFEENSSIEYEVATTVSWIDTEDDLETRTEELALRGIPCCQCERCVLERYQQKEADEEELSDFSTASFGRLLGLAKEQQRHEDSFLICNMMLKQNPSDPTILFHRARVAGWMGDYDVRESYLEQAEAVSPDNLSIKRALLETRAYYQNKSDGVTIAINAAGKFGSPSTFHKIEGLHGDAFTLEGLLRKEDCARMISLAEKYQSESGGWTTSRHYAVPTTDVPIYQMPVVLQWFNEELERCIFPTLQEQFNPGGRLRIFDAFFVKYDAASGQRRLPLHNDQSVYSLTIAMNGLEEYQGGGTYFAKIGKAIKTDVGGVVSFKGELVHAGKQLQNGIRYIIACFIYVEKWY